MGGLVAAVAPAALVDALVFPDGWLVAGPPVDRTVVAVRPATVLAVAAPGTVVLAASAGPEAGALLSPAPLAAGTFSPAAPGSAASAFRFPSTAATTSLCATLVPHAATSPAAMTRAIRPRQETPLRREGANDVW